MLSEGFWAATHLPLYNPSSLTSEQHLVTLTVVESTCGNCRERSEIVTSTVRENLCKVLALELREVDFVGTITSCAMPCVQSIDL